jgi:pimeloyl-ACP methyl ester carboxylesterase
MTAPNAIAAGSIERAFVSIAEGQVHLRQIVVADPLHVPLFLFHASPSSSRWMKPMMRALAGQGRTVIAPDTLGNGDSPAPATAEPDIAYFADSVFRLADAMGIERFDVYGTHTGARIACELAAACPNRVAHAVLDGITDYGDAMRDKILARYAPKIVPDEYGAHMIWAFNFVRDQALFFPHFEKIPANRLNGPMPSPQILHDAALDVLKAFDTYPLPYLAAFRYRALERMPLIEAPVLLLKADSELAILNASVAAAAAAISRATITAVASDPAAKAAAIGTFLDTPA